MCYDFINTDSSNVVGMVYEGQSRRPVIVPIECLLAVCAAVIAWQIFHIPPLFNASSEVYPVEIPSIWWPYRCEQIANGKNSTQAKCLMIYSANLSRYTSVMDRQTDRTVVADLFIIPPFAVAEVRQLLGYCCYCKRRNNEYAESIL